VCDDLQTGINAREVRLEGLASRRKRLRPQADFVVLEQVKHDEYGGVLRTSSPTRVRAVLRRCCKRPNSAAPCSSQMTISPSRSVPTGSLEAARRISGNQGPSSLRFRLRSWQDVAVRRQSRPRKPSSFGS
jgi:hypothetical protein